MDTNQTPTSPQPLTREQVETLTNGIDTLTERGWTMLRDHDAAQRAQIDRSMRVQETLAKNVNEGLLKIRDLRARVEALQQALASIEKDAKQMREASYE